jgi:hypothetical protein
VGILTGLWVFFSCLVGLFVGCFEFSFLGSEVLFPFSVSCRGLAFGASCIYFMCTKGRLYAFLINLFLPIKKKKRITLLGYSVAKLLSDCFAMSINKYGKIIIDQKLLEDSENLYGDGIKTPMSGWV